MGAPNPRKHATKTLSDRKINEYIQGIYDGDITELNLPSNVYDSIVEYLKKGLYEGFGASFDQMMKLAEDNPGRYGTDFELLDELRENVYMFGAAKTYAMTKAISELLFDEDGELRTNKEFNAIAKDTYSDWNDNWGETEYSTAIGQGYAAQQWHDIEKQKHILPNLRYSAIGDACEICGPLDGLTAPVDDPVWTTISPLNHFNCKCILLQEDDGAILTDDDEKIELFDSATSKMSPIFASNPGQDGMVFNENHPYFEEARLDHMGKDNFGLNIPKKD